ncbi:hypothetical protein AVEN_192140-1 [Araneus ventricosus]|uniref:FBD domain-containing protein n=1 Tax=Araneus ventricosus TaxID=182803 RepID=A0A4Y2LI22_ARAVE|nr:hypothetical protein AVEN_192140-1 [Araneus ventricosus]
MSSLYMICLDRIYGFLKEGMWKSCTPNPFSDLPTKAVNELMDISDDKKDYSKIGDVLLLLTSGRLTRLDLCPFNPKAEQGLIVSAIQKTGSICLRNFPLNSEELIFHFVRNIISWNPYLEEFHSKVHPGFDVLLKCPNLRILKIYYSFEEFPVNNAPLNLPALSSLRNLEVLHVYDMDTDTIANVLETCPKLISIGLNDSLDSLEEIAQRRQKNSFLNLDVNRHFQLRRCAWGKDYRSENRHERRVYNSSFRNKVISAVNLCPLVQELIIHVHQKDGYEALRSLKQLTLLRIHFENCVGDFLPDFVALLLEIGPQLKHLSVFGKEEPFRRNAGVPVDVICEICPHLQSLQIWSSIFMKDSSKSSCDLSLKRLTLYVEHPDVDEETHDEEECLLFLLSNSKHLEELYLEHGLDDTLLNQIFQKNSLAQLKVSCIEESSLTREGFQMFLEKAASIETVLVLSDRGQHFYDANRLFKDANIRYSKEFYAYVKLKEFFYCRLNEKRF